MLAVAGGASYVTADPVESFLDEQTAKLEETVPGKFSINARTRYEIFDLDSGKDSDDRDGTSLRVRYGYTTPNFSGFTAMVEGETVTRLGGDHDDIHPLDDAGDGTDLNQAWVQYANEDYGKAKVGRQIYSLDDHRFIGHVGWRQNIQTFDAATADYTGIENLSVKAFFSDAVNRVNGDYFKMDTYGANISYKFYDNFTLTGFYYEMDNADNVGFENDTIGLRAVGSFNLGEQKFKYAGSVAKQDFEDLADGTDDATYLAGDLSTVVAGITFGAGFEILEAGFRTPVATVHKFNGFADVYTPITGYENGLEDFYGYIGYTIPVGNGIPVKLIYHTFDAESGAAAGQDGGDEIDLVASYKVNKYLNLLAKYGNYSEDGGIGALSNGTGAVGGLDKEMFTFEVNFIY